MSLRQAWAVLGFCLGLALVRSLPVYPPGSLVSRHVAAIWRGVALGAGMAWGALTAAAIMIWVADRAYDQRRKLARGAEHEYSRRSENDSAP